MAVPIYAAIPSSNYQLPEPPASGSYFAAVSSFQNATYTYQNSADTLIVNNRVQTFQSATLGPSTLTLGGSYILTSATQSYNLTVNYLGSSNSNITQPCKPSTVVATTIDYTNQFTDSIVVTFVGGPLPIRLDPGQSTGPVTDISSYTINCFTPCEPSTVTFTEPTIVPYILNTFLTPIVVTVENVKPRNDISNLVKPIDKLRAITINPGQYVIPPSSLTSYTIRCPSIIDITCNSQPSLTAPNAVTFVNRDISDIVIASDSFPPLILSPGQSSDQFVDITTYTAQCVTPVILDVSCTSDPVPLTAPNAVTFRNIESESSIQIVTTSYGSFIIAPGASSQQYLNVDSYTS